MKRCLPAVLLLLGCTPEAEAPAPKPAAALSDAAEKLVEGYVKVRDAPPAAAPATPGEFKTFRDWTVGCDNTLRCTMASLGPEQGEFPEVTLALSRDAGPSGGVSLVIETLGDNAAKPAALVIDGQRFAVGGTATAAAPIANGRSLTVQSRSGMTLATISLAGAAAALRYIDSMQGRAGTVTAIVAKGTASASGVPAASTLPTIVAIAPAGTSATPTAAQLATMRRTGKCEGMAVEQPDVFKPETHALGGGRTLVLLPCSAGAYNITAVLFVIADDKVTPAQTDRAAGFGGDTGVPGVVNGGFEDGILTSYVKARGLGDCGVTQSFVWDGTRFRLVEQKEMGECRGNPNFITTWRARVARR